LSEDGTEREPID